MVQYPATNEKRGKLAKENQGFIESHQEETRKKEGHMIPCPKCHKATARKANRIEKKEIRNLLIEEDLFSSDDAFYIIVCTDDKCNWWTADKEPIKVSEIEPFPPTDSEMLSNLLAILIGDGGHYEEEHGTQKAYDEAVRKHYEKRLNEE